jgi:hypothetical protein
VMAFSGSLLGLLQLVAGINLAGENGSDYPIDSRRLSD